MLAEFCQKLLCVILAKPLNITLIATDNKIRVFSARTEYPTTNKRIMDNVNDIIYHFLFARRETMQAPADY
jgi:hypothetical protein